MDLLPAARRISASSLVHLAILACLAFFIAAQADQPGDASAGAARPGQIGTELNRADQLSKPEEASGTCNATVTLLSGGGEIYSDSVCYMLLLDIPNVIPTAELPSPPPMELIDGDVLYQPPSTTCGLPPQPAASFSTTWSKQLQVTVTVPASACTAVDLRMSNLQPPFSLFHYTLSSCGALYSVALSEGCCAGGQEPYMRWLPSSDNAEECVRQCKVKVAVTTAPPRGKHIDSSKACEQMAHMLTQHSGVQSLSCSTSGQGGWLLEGLMPVAESQALFHYLEADSGFGASALVGGFNQECQAMGLHASSDIVSPITHEDLGFSDCGGSFEYITSPCPSCDERQLPDGFRMLPGSSVRPNETYSPWDVMCVDGELVLPACPETPEDGDPPPLAQEVGGPTRQPSPESLPSTVPSADPARLGGLSELSVDVRRTFSTVGACCKEGANRSSEACAAEWDLGDTFIISPGNIIRPVNDVSTASLSATTLYGPPLDFSWRDEDPERVFKLRLICGHGVMTLSSEGDSCSAGVKLELPDKPGYVRLLIRQDQWDDPPTSPWLPHPTIPAPPIPASPMVSNPGVGGDDHDGEDGGSDSSHMTTVLSLAVSLALLLPCVIIAAFVGLRMRGKWHAQLPFSCLLHGLKLDRNPHPPKPAPPAILSSESGPPLGSVHSGRGRGHVVARNGDAGGEDTSADMSHVQRWQMSSSAVLSRVSSLHQEEEEEEGGVSTTSGSLARDSLQVIHSSSFEHQCALTSPPASLVCEGALSPASLQMVAAIDKRGEGGRDERGIGGRDERGNESGGESPGQSSQVPAYPSNYLTRPDSAGQGPAFPTTHPAALTTTASPPLLTKTAAEAATAEAATAGQDANSSGESSSMQLDKSTPFQAGLGDQFAHCFRPADPPAAPSPVLCSPAAALSHSSPAVKSSLAYCNADLVHAMSDEEACVRDTLLVNAAGSTASASRAMSTLYQHLAAAPSGDQTLGQGTGRQAHVNMEMEFGEIQFEKGGSGLLGVGSVGSVFRATFRGHPVAVKVITHSVVDGSFSGAGAHADSLHLEIQILSRLSHPNIVHMLGGCQRPPRVFLVEELMCSTLCTVIHRTSSNALPLDRILRLSLDIARGLKYLHAQHVVHRDLKPANILLDAAGNAKISDFGLARCKYKTYIETKQTDAGTVAYMAPEAFNPDIGGLGPKCDVFSLGVILWEMVTQYHPWEGHPNMVIIYRVAVQHARNKLPEASQSVPPQLLQLIESCWQHEPSKRPTASEVLKALENLAHAHGLNASPHPVDVSVSL